MRDTDLFQLALGLQSPWMVTRSEFAVEDGQLDLHVDFPRGSRFACAECGDEGCAVHCREQVICPEVSPGKAGGFKVGGPSKGPRGPIPSL